MPIDPTAGAVIKAGADLLNRPKPEGATLIPRLEVRGNGSGNILGFNLQLQNAGKSIAYGVQVGVPWGHLRENKTQECPSTEWWELDRRWWSKILYEWLPAQLPSRKLKNWLKGKRLFMAKDVGLILAPTENVDMYFGLARLTPNDSPAMVWSPGQITELTLIGYDRAPSWPWARKRSCTLALAIHSTQGVAVSAHTFRESSTEPTSSLPITL